MKINELFENVILENLKYELKAVLNSEDPLKWAKTLVAFANGEGGIMFIGVNDNQDAFGLTIKEIDQTKNLIALVNDRHIFPHIKYKYMLRSVDEGAEKFVLAIEVKPSESVVRYREGDFNETVYIKGDGNTMPASPEDIISLSKRKMGIDDETTNILYHENNWTTYLELSQEYRTNRTTPTIKELQNEEIVSKDGYVKSGFLMFEDHYFNDDSLIVCRLWKGLDKTGEVLDNRRLKGPLGKVFKEALEFIDRNTKHGWKKTDNGGRKELNSYPVNAIREALVNAIAHRDYSIIGTQIDVNIYDNRLEIVSPGSWLLPKSYEEYTLGAIPSIRRNKIIAAALDIANLMERGGTGFQTMAKSYEEFDDKFQPCVSVYPGFLNLCLFDVLYQNTILDDLSIFKEKLSTKQQILELLKIGPKSIKELQSATSYKSRTAFLKEVINPLIKENLIYREGNPRSNKSLIYFNK